MVCLLFSLTTARVIACVFFSQTTYHQSHCMCVLLTDHISPVSLHVCSSHEPHMDPLVSLHVCSSHRPHMDPPSVIACMFFPQTTYHWCHCMCVLPMNHTWIHQCHCMCVLPKNNTWIHQGHCM